MRKLPTLLLLVFLASVLYAAKPMRVFLLGTPLRIHPVLIQNDVYLPLADVASLFRLKATVDLEARRIVLEPLPEETSPPSNGTGGEHVIEGRTEISPLFRLKVRLFKASSSWNEERTRRALEAWILRDDPAFYDSRGQVAETMADAKGTFSFSRVPPGSYELVAFASISPSEIGYWWVPLRVVKGEMLRVSLDPQAMTRITLSRKKIF